MGVAKRNPFATPFSLNPNLTKKKGVKKMRAKTIIFTCIITSFLTSTYVAPSGVSAAPAVMSLVTSSAIVVFTDGTGPVNPRDPDNPTEDSEENPTGTGATGPLTIDYISTISFGTQSVTSTETTYSAQILKPYLQVSDRRGLATGAGWKVQASAALFANGASQTLVGAKITLTSGEALSGTDGSSGGLNTISNVVIKTDETNTAVLTASSGQGVGTWIERWYPTNSGTATANDNVRLTVPPNPPVGSYTATITWSLIDAP